MLWSIESNISISKWQESRDFFGVVDLGTSYIDMLRQLERSCQVFLKVKKVWCNKRYKARKPNAWQEVG